MINNEIKRALGELGDYIVHGGEIKQRLQVEAVVIRACTNCGAPGVDKESNKYVGPICPNCGAQRPDNEDKGKIFDSHPLWLIKRSILRLLGRNV